MSVKKYSLKTNRNLKLSENFKVCEFGCRDGSDEVKIDTGLVELLQKIRNHFAKPVIVVSGYRTPAYNAAIGGAKASQHMYGKAADITIAGVTPREIVEYAETLNPGGLGLYEYGGYAGFVHIDTRQGRARWLQKSRNGGAVAVNGFYKASNKSLLRYGSRCSGVYELQSILNRKDFDCGAVDGIFGPKTLAAVKAFQAAENITVDGIVGPVTWSRLLK